jgi:putative ABC transport system permease protein
MNALRLAMRIALRNLGVRKGRSVLMMSGVAVGIVTLVLVTAITGGTSQNVEKSIQSFGPDAIMVTSGSPQTRGPGDERVTTLVAQDLEAIRSSIVGIRVVVPIVARAGETVIAGDRNTTLTVVGSTPELEEAWEQHAESGEFLSEAHEASLARVVVLGKTAVRDLFGKDDPIGQDIRIREQKFKVIGIAEPKGTSPMGMDMDNRAFIPLSTAMRRLYNVDNYSMIRFRITEGIDMQRTAAQVTSLMRQRHNIRSGDTDDFSVRSPVSMRQMAAKMSRTLTLLLGIITFVALGAGALVLTNILTVAVNERRTEIGVRRAVGASRKQISQQFLLEGVVVTILGGLIGIVLGATAILALRAGTKLPVVLDWQPFVLGFVVTVVVGVLASFLPARRAASTKVVDALRP